MATGKRTKGELKQKALQDLCLRLVTECQIDVGCCARTAIENLAKPTRDRSLSNPAPAPRGRLQSPSDNQPVLYAAGVAGLWADYEWLNIRWPQLIVELDARTDQRSIPRPGEKPKIKCTTAMLNVFASVPVT